MVASLYFWIAANTIAIRLLPMRSFLSAGRGDVDRNGHYMQMVMT